MDATSIEVTGSLASNTGNLIKPETTSPNGRRQSAVESPISSSRYSKMSVASSTILQSSIISTPRIDEGESWCALNDPSLPPVTEMEHMVDQCFCYLCNCRKHICPGDYRRMYKSASSQFSTMYKIKFPKHKLPNLRKNVKEAYIRNSLPIDLKTTNKNDFKPFPIEPKKKKEHNLDYLKLKFTGKSFYKTEYPNWGEYHAEQVHMANLPYRGGEVKFSGASSYAKDFRKKEEFLDLNVRLPSPTQLKNSNVISPSSEFIGTSTFARDFKPFNKKNVPKREKAISEDFQRGTDWNGQFATTYRKTFTGEMNISKKRKKAYFSHH